ncbi:LysE family transporter [Ichthyenterobacterium sp. W332]|uniref:LysE family transporter n=1 Tax=Microcosmobacter mediterraneus TaxID=3075607 RepID=A0ABU2YLG1_9FLAO|nr:LysE family transporter [Ichthyenterobacterium sp. W332]MDT0558994.1 LysE family transporter [Ichthyenterobacterium sp. W332]
MNFIIYFLIGSLTAILGALPLGTTNVAVINTTIKEDVKQALKIIYPAAIAELFLITIAINFNMQIENFVDMNIWLQYSIAIIMLAIGVFLFFGRKECIKDENEECIIIKKRYNISKQTLGFILGFFNPTVLVYWILVISFLNKKMIYLTTKIDYSLLFLFIVGAFIGKVITLYIYGKFSHLLKIRVKNMTQKINRVIGILLVFVSLVQFIKLLYY